MAASSKAKSSDEKKTTSFEDIGRIIGKRWRNISDEELATYKEMAAKDTTRYRKEMKQFHKDELTLMCLGHNTNGIELPSQHIHRTNDSPNEPDNTNVNISAHSNRIVREVGHSTEAINASTKMVATSASDGDKKPSAVAAVAAVLLNENKQLMDRVQKQQLMMNTMNSSQYMQGQGSYMNTSSPVEPVQVQAPMAHQSVNDHQLLNMLLQQQQQQQRHQNSALSSSSAVANVQNQSLNPISGSVLLNQIMSQKAVIDQQQKQLKHEFDVSRLKNALLENMLLGDASSQAGNPKQDEELKPASALSAGPFSQRMSAADVLSTEILLRNARRGGGLQTANWDSSQAPPNAAMAAPQASNLQQLFLRHEQQLILAAQRQSPQQTCNQRSASNSSSQYENLLRLLQESNNMKSE